MFIEVTAASTKTPAWLKAHSISPHALPSPVSLHLSPNDCLPPPSFLIFIHSRLLAHPFCPNLTLESSVSISIRRCVELIWGLDRCTPSFLPHPLPHYSSMREIKLPRVEGGGDGQTGSEGRKEAGAAHKQVLVTACLSGSCQLQLARRYIIQVSLCSAIFALPPSSLSPSSPPPYLRSPSSLFTSISFMPASSDLQTPPPSDLSFFPPAL